MVSCEGKKRQSGALSFNLKLFLNILGKFSLSVYQKNTDFSCNIYSVSIFQNIIGKHTK